MTHPFAGAHFDDLVRMPHTELDRVMAAGPRPTREALAGWEWRGFNPPVFAKLLGFQKFVKGFFVDEADRLAGYNLFVERPRGGVGRPWKPKRGGAPDTRHGFYDVVPVRAGTRYDDFPNAVLLDYGSGRNAPWNPESRIRDFLVQVDPDNPDLYLGKAFLDLGVTRVFSNFFILDRLRRAPA